MFSAHEEEYPFVEELRHYAHTESQLKLTRTTAGIHDPMYFSLYRQPGNRLYLIPVPETSPVREQVH